MANQSILKSGLLLLAIAVLSTSRLRSGGQSNRPSGQRPDRDPLRLRKAQRRAAAPAGGGPVCRTKNNKENGQASESIPWRNLFQGDAPALAAPTSWISGLGRPGCRRLWEHQENFGIKTDEDYEEALRQSGLTREGLRDQIENSLRVREVFGLEVYSEVAVEEEDLRRYYTAHPDEFRTTTALLLREIIVLESSGSPEERAALAKELRDAIVAGEVDQLLAETQADGRSTGWIDLGWVESGDLDPQLQAAIEGLEVNAVSEPTAARGGLHLLEVVERRESRVLEFAEIRQQLEEAERGRRIEKRQAEYLRDLEDEAFIIAHPPPDAADFRAELTAAAPTLVEGGLGTEPADVQVP